MTKIRRVYAYYLLGRMQLYKCNASQNISPIRVARGFRRVFYRGFATEGRADVLDSTSSTLTE